MIGEACQGVGLLCSCLRLPREHGAERLETVVGQARQCIGLHGNSFQLPREACFDGAGRF